MTGVACDLRDMIKHSQEWARQRNLLSKSEVHGAMEWRIPTKKSFAWARVKGHKVMQSATIETQERWM